jgi:hypothetical protein
MGSHLTFRSPPSALARVIVFDLGCMQQRFLAQVHAPERAFGLFLGDDLRIFTRRLTAHPLSWGPNTPQRSDGALDGSEEVMSGASEGIYR